MPWTEQQYDQVASVLVRRGLGPLAIVALEAGRPFSFVGNQFLVFMDPILKLFGDVPGYRPLLHLLEDRDRIESLILAVERAEDEA